MTDLQHRPSAPHHLCGVLFLLVLGAFGCDDATGTGPAVEPDADAVLDSSDQDPDTVSETGCGNGVLEAGEICDSDALNGATCESQGYAGGALACRADCLGFDPSGCGIEASCGDGVREPPEVCDANDLAAQSCITRGFAGGTLACAPDCQAFDTGACVRASACGDGVRAPQELCDGDDLGGATCTSEGFAGGTLRCESGCMNFDVSQCTLCGNGAIDPGEACDDTDMAGATCESRGFDGGQLACDVACSFDQTGCTSLGCGDGIVSGNEDCEGSDLDGASCMSEGFAGGTLSCAGNCRFDTGGCYVCGDGTADSTEVCDGSDLKARTCANLGQGFTDGMLACANDCSSFDTAGCTTCGDGVIETGEACDEDALDGASCTSIGQGFTGGTLACGTVCALDTSGCTVCGDGTLGPGEACEPSALTQTCIDLGYDAGSLGCTPDCASVDESGCTRAPSPSVGDVVVSEIMADPSVLADTSGEWVELHNRTGGALSVNGCDLVSTTSTGTEVRATILGAPPMPPGAWLVLATESAGGPGFVPDAYYPSIALENEGDDLRLECGANATVIDAVTWDAGGVFPDPVGASLTLSPAALSASANDNGANWCVGTTVYATGGAFEDAGTPGAANDECAALYFSEYVEGSSRNKAIEVRNPGSADQALRHCILERYSNGGVTPTNITLNGSIAAGDVHVLCDPAFAQPARCDETNSLFNVNGDDTVALVCAEVVRDVFGRIGEKPTDGAWTGSATQCAADDTPCASAADCGGGSCTATTIATAGWTLRRKCGIESGDPDGSDPFDPSVEWLAWPQDTFDGLGASGCGAP